MERNIIFCFTGTGNSLKVSKDIANSLENCDIYNMGDKNIGFNLSGYTRVGFVFPVYFLGLPVQVNKFIKRLKISPSSNRYFYAIATYANISGNATRQVETILKGLGQRLNYAINIKMGDNAIAFYGSKPNLDRLNASYTRAITKIIPKIARQQTVRIGLKFWPAEQYYKKVIPGMRNRDTGFEVLDTCNMCGICADLCLVRNISINNKKPEFNHRCQQCMACIQLCPQKAIDYKGKCIKRNRYKHPEISINELIRFQAGV